MDWRLDLEGQIFTEPGEAIFQQVADKKGEAVTCSSRCWVVVTFSWRNSTVVCFFLAWNWTKVVTTIWMLSSICDFFCLRTFAEIVFFCVFCLMTILKGEKYKIQEIKSCPSEIRCTFYTSNTPLPKPHLNNAHILQGMSWSVIAEIQKSTGEKAPHLIGLHPEKSHRKRHLKSESSRIGNLWYMHTHTLAKESEVIL